MVDDIEARLKHLKYRAASGYEAMRLSDQIRAKGDSRDLLRTVGDVNPYRIICGFREDVTGKSCPGVLGETHPFQAARPTPAELVAAAANRLANGRPPERGEWYVFHPKRLQRQADGSYRVFTRSKKPDPRGWRVDEEGRPRGRRPLPSGLTAGRPRLPGAPTAKDVVGASPLLPAVIVCPVCGRRNRVAAPEKLRGRIETANGTFVLPD